LGELETDQPGAEPPGMERPSFRARQGVSKRAKSRAAQAILA